MLLNKERLQKEADRLNSQNMELLNSLQEHFGEDIPIYMDAVSEDEIPNDNMTYVVIETGNYDMTNPQSKSTVDTVNVYFFSEGRNNPTYDQLAIVASGIGARLHFQNANKETIVLDETNRLIGVFVASFTRQVLKGCV